MTTTPFDAAWEYPLSSRGWINLRTGRMYGLDHGPAVVTGAQYVPGLGWVVTLYEGGLSYWAGRGSRGYGGAQIHTLLVDLQDGIRHVRYVRLTTVPAGLRRLVAALRNKVHQSRRFDGDVTLAEVKAFVEAAHIGLSALGAMVPERPRDLHLLVQDILDSVDLGENAHPRDLAVAQTDALMCALAPTTIGRATSGGVVLDDDALDRLAAAAWARHPNNPDRR